MKVLHKLCNEILRTTKWPNQWTESVLITIPKNANTGKCSEHRTINLISHASKVMLKIIQKIITSRIEEVLSESQAGFSRGRTTVQQITTLQILNEKARDIGSLIFHNFIDFRKAFYRVWHEGRKKCFSFRGARPWNGLTVECKQASSLYSFKKYLI